MTILEKKIYGSLIGGIIGDAMGAPCEDMKFDDIIEKYGWVTDFEGAGTDDSAIKQILCDAILKHNGSVTADEWAESFLEHRDYYPLFFIPVKNMFHKIESQIELPVYCGLGNMQSSSSAMAIAPLGLINACNPYLASMQTYDVAGLIHAGTTTFCRDGACVISTAIAEAMKTKATVESVIETAIRYLHPKSSAVMLNKIKEVLSFLDQCNNDYFAFRSGFYEQFLQDIVSDSRETVPCVLALFKLANGDPEKAITYAANFGRDADTLGAMVGSLVGAFAGIDNFPKAWIAKVELKYGTEQHISKDEYTLSSVIVKNQKDLAAELAKVAIHRYKQFVESYENFSSMEVE